MFRGMHTTRVDEKGRLKVPAEYKRELDENKSTQFYITSINGKIANIYPLDQWEEVEQKLAKVPDSNPDKQKYLDVTNYYGQVVEMDGQGRLLLPAMLREKAELKGDVTVVGNQKLLQVRNLEAFTKQIEENPVTNEDIAGFAALGV